MKDFEELYKIFDNSKYGFKIKNGIFEVKDKKSGMKCKIKLKSESICTSEIEDDNKFCHLKLKNCADAVIITKNSNNYELHILEMKRTIKYEYKRIFEKLYKQFLGAYLRAISILAVYCKIEKVNFYLLYENQINLKSYSKSTNKKKDYKQYTNLILKNQIKNNFQLKISPFDTETLEIIIKCTKNSKILEI